MRRHSTPVLLVVTRVCVSAAHAARPVARWGVIPDQLIDDVFSIGVVAFHFDDFLILKNNFGAGM